MKDETTFGGRLEDRRLVTGRGNYLDDIKLVGELHATFMRSPVAHARIIEVDTEMARSVPGVVAVLTGEDIRHCGYGTIPVLPQENADGSPMFVPPWYPLAIERVRYVGESVALIVAETLAAAETARDCILLDYEDLEVIGHASQEGAPIWDEAPSNQALHHEAGDASAVDSAIASATHVIEVSVASQRLAPAPMETRAVHADWDKKSGKFTLTAGSQGAAALAREVASILGEPEDKVRVVSPDTGGGFGSKTHAYPDYAALLHASKVVGHPIKWTPTRTEAFLTDSHGRDSELSGQLALDAEGRFLGMRVRSTINIGAYHTAFTTFTATRNLFNSLAGVYRFPCLHTDIRCSYTNTNPTAPYRGAGRPEANLILEALVEKAARVTGIDRVELRRRNLVEALEMPYVAANGMTYCSGDFPAVLDRALELASALEFPERRNASEAKGRLRGLGIACYLEIAGVIPFEAFRLDLDEEGLVKLNSGLHANGQGHETVFRGLVADQLGIPIEQTSLPESDSDLVPDGVGSFASRSAMVGSAAAMSACKALIEAVLDRAGTLLQAPKSELSYADGVVEHKGTGQKLTLADVTRQTGAVWVKAHSDIPPSFPNGCHIAEIEIEIETGITRLIDFTAVDDVGNRMNPVLVEGQLHGGIAQGLGQFLIEHVIYDAETAQMLSATFMDYALPRADMLVDFRCDHVDVPSPNNPLGVKGVGEAGTSGSLAAAYNAIMDALSHVGLERFDMPATPPRVWEALRSVGITEKEDLK